MQNKSYFVLSTKLNYGKLSIIFAATKTWNEIPLSIKNNQSVKSFKNNYKNT